jgi:hypothetical protein
MTAPEHTTVDSIEQAEVDEIEDGRLLDNGDAPEDDEDDE